MSYLQSIYHSKVYRDFQEIEPTAYLQIIHFFEDKEGEIKNLEFEEYFELLHVYVDALFEVGAYQKHLLMVDTIIENSILHNIKFRNGTDIYHRTLFKKAASLYNTLQYEEADYILRELIKMDPYDSDSVQFLKKCLRSKNNRLVNNARAVSIFLFLLTAFVICIEVLFVRPFYSLHTELVETSRISIFFLGCSILLGGDLAHRWAVEREVNQFVDMIRKVKY